MSQLSVAEAAAFAQRWLPAWTGNDPERLAAFYSDDALYLDPGIPAGVRGKTELLAYFRKLLANNPNWVWTQLEAIPLQDGFLNKWLARIPVGANTLEIVGVCLVQFDAAGRIRRNEVYFDRSGLLAQIAQFKLKKTAGQSPPSQESG
jgi:SnoaL-like protein